MFIQFSFSFLLLSSRIALVCFCVAVKLHFILIKKKWERKPFGKMRTMKKRSLSRMINCDLCFWLMRFCVVGACYKVKIIPEKLHCALIRLFVRDLSTQQHTSTRFSRWREDFHRFSLSRSTHLVWKTMLIIHTLNDSIDRRRAEPRTRAKRMWKNWDNLYVV